MALPTVLSGLSTAASSGSPVGPFQSSGGNYYVIGVSSSVGALAALKASDPTVSFGSSFNSGSVTGVQYLAAFQVGNVVHIAINVNGTAIKYLTFDMSTDTWSSVSSVASTNSPSTNYQVGIVVRSTGEIVVGFPGNYNSVMGTHYSTVYYTTSTNSGSTWGTPVEIDAGSTTNWQGVVAVLGASDTVHFLWDAGASTATQQRALNSSNVLQTATSNSGTLTPPSGGVSYNNAGTTKVIVGTDGGATGGYNLYFDSGNTPTINSASLPSVGSAPVRFYNDGTDAWALGNGDTSRTVYAAKSTDNGSTWGTKTSTGDTLGSATEAYLSLNANVYTRGTRVVIPFVFYDGTNLKYDEYLIRTVSGSFTLSGAVGSISLTGKTGNAFYSRVSSAASYALTGIANAWGKGISAAIGTYTLTGKLANAFYNRVSSPASYTLTGIANAWGKGISAAIGAYTLTGKLANAFFSVAAAIGSYILTGKLTNAFYKRASNAASFSLTGIANAWGKGISAAVGIYTLAGDAANAFFSVSAAVGSYILTGIAATLTYVANAGFTLSAAAGSYALTGIANAWGKGISAAVGAYTLTGNLANAFFSRVSSATSFVLTGSPVNAFYGLISSIGSYTLTGIANAWGKGISAVVGVYTLAGKPANAFYGLTSSIGSYILTGALANAFYGLISSVGSYILTGITASFAVALSLVANAGSYILNGISATLSYAALILAKVLVAGAAMYNLVGRAARLKERLVPRLYDHRATQATLYYARSMAASLGKARSSLFSLAKIRTMAASLYKARNTPPSLED